MTKVNKVKSNTAVLLLMAALTTVFISGCQNIAPVTSGVGSDQVAPGQKFEKHLQVDNPELGKKLYISDIKTRTNNDLLEINVSLTSTFKKTLKLQYQFAWFDKDGFVVEPEKSPWKPLDLHGMQTEAVPGLAPTNTVTSFTVYVREVPEQFFKF